MAGLERSLDRQVEKGKRTEADRDATLARVTGDRPTSATWPSVDLVIESVVEDLDGEEGSSSASWTGSCATATILATNTSTLPVIELAMETGRPEKVCGIHFFNPAPVMALVEIVRPLTACDETMRRRRRSPRRAARSRSR